MHDLFQNIVQYHDLLKNKQRWYELIYLYLSNTDKVSSVIFVYKAHHWSLDHMWFPNKFELCVFKIYNAIL